MRALKNSFYVLKRFYSQIFGPIIVLIGYKTILKRNQVAYNIGYSWYYGDHLELGF